MSNYEWINVIHNDLDKTIKDFENATTDPSNENYLSDGEWLDVFYNLCCEIRDYIEA